VPRSLEPGEDRALVGALRRSKFLLRRSPVGLDLVLPDGTVALSKGAQRTTTVRGPAGELVLFAFGRQAHSDVAYEGPDADVEQIRTASLGL
jgi:hypothetical protein